MSNQDNIAAQEHLAGNINDGNVATVVEAFAEDAVDHAPAPGQRPGRAGFRDFWTTITTAFPDAHIEPRHELVADEHVVVAYTLTGTHLGDFQGISPTGKKVQISGIQIGRFEDAQIVERWGSSDELGILKQLGAASDEV